MSGAARHAIENSRLRQLGYRLLPGEGFAYLLHMRPREWPIMLAHTTLGFLLAQGLGATLSGAHAGALAAGLAVWVVLLNGGTLAINSAYDNDVGDIGYLDNPPPPPAHLARWGFALMLGGQVLALLLPRGFAIAYAICFAMSLLYSVPPARLKAVAGADWIINVIGFGTLTPYAGWALSAQPLTSAGAWALGGFAPLFAALYPLTQIYQLDQDRARGDRTLAIALGVRGSLAIALLSAAIAFACFARAAALAANAGRFSVGAIALGVAALVWFALLVQWLVRAPAMLPAAHKRGMYAALGAWALTDLAVLLAVAP
ncbi:MAG TPA: UbiA family prenyltransferase [Gemmatimonadaceae bacterium]|nr:UbiA family prenyltransferase [Gemmatimonadaceae bacterium]